MAASCQAEQILNCKLPIFLLSRGCRDEYLSVLEYFRKCFIKQTRSNRFTVVTPTLKDYQNVKLKVLFPWSFYIFDALFPHIGAITYITGLLNVNVSS